MKVQFNVSLEMEDAIKLETIARNNDKTPTEAIRAIILTELNK